MRYNIPRGMSQRLFIATMAMQGLIASGYTGSKVISKVSYEYADELLKEENE